MFLNYSNLFPTPLFWSKHLCITSI